ncbi:MAG TPA: hypothetical protein QF564_31175, partial [Pirellulaceae bacterium]|nr:hypothetical protein [Pirellulaceae bacterium]
KNVDSHRHVQKTEPQLLFVSSQIHQGQTAKSTGPKPIERNSVNGYQPSNGFALFSSKDFGYLERPAGLRSRRPAAAEVPQD